MDYHRNSGNFVAARFFRWEHKLKLPAHRQLDSHPDRSRRDTRRFEPGRDHIDLRFVEHIKDSLS